MTTSTALVPVEYGGLVLAPPRPEKALPTPDEMAMMKDIAATVMNAGGMVPDTYDNPLKALAVMIRGKECGLTPMSSLDHIFLVNGRTALDTQTLIGLVRANDPTAQFIFHRYDHQGADVELIRGGKSIIRVTYTEEDRQRSKQGMKQKRDMTTKVRGRNGDYNPVLKVNGVVQYEVDPESPWGKYGRDMYAYNAIKRCTRLGAPDCILGITNYGYEADRAPTIALDARNEGDEPDAPRSELTKALLAGDVKPEAVFADGEAEPTVSTVVPSLDPAPDADGVLESQAPAVAEETLNSKPDPRALERINLQMLDLMQSWSASDYGKVYRDFATRFTPDLAGENKGKFRPEFIATVRLANECLAELRRLRGEPPEEGNTMTQETQDKPATEPAEEESKDEKVTVESGDTTTTVESDAGDGDGDEEDGEEEEGA